MADIWRDLDEGESRLFLGDTAIGVLTDAPQGGFYYTWDAGQRRHWFATLEDLRDAFGNRGQALRVGSS